MNWVVRLCSILVWLVLIVGGFAAYEANRFLSTPGSRPGREVLFVIAPGATFDRVAWDLKKAGAISDVTRFRLLAWTQNAVSGIKAGEYLIDTGWLPGEVLRQITKGQTVQYRLAIREGLTWWETARAVEAQGFARFEDFKAVIHDPAFLREHNIPFANAEGFLFPETYLLPKPRALGAVSPAAQPARPGRNREENPGRAQAREVASAMVKMFWKRTEPFWPQMARERAAPRDPLSAGPVTVTSAQAVARNLPETANTAPPPAPGPGGAVLPDAAAPANATAPSGPPLTPADMDPALLRRFVTLASLVEKETGLPLERPRVAGVYANRLRLNMLLQCDPTIIYGIGESFKGEILRSQLNDPKNRYNTYKHPGLPPGPICSPGLASLQAAAAPETHDYLYFVATGLDGGHAFSVTIAEHNRAVQIYRARMREKEAAARRGNTDRTAPEPAAAPAPPAAIPPAAPPAVPPGAAGASSQETGNARTPGSPLPLTPAPVNFGEGTGLAADELDDALPGAPGGNLRSSPASPETPGTASPAPPARPVPAQPPAGIQGQNVDAHARP